jgi:hypothetical protein
LPLREGKKILKKARDKLFKFRHLLEATKVPKAAPKMIKYS